MEREHPGCGRNFFLNEILIELFPRSITDIIIIYQISHSIVHLKIHYEEGIQTSSFDDVNHPALVIDLNKVDKPGCAASLFAQHYLCCNSRNLKFIPLHNVKWYNDDRDRLIAIYDVINKYLRVHWEIYWKYIDFIKYPGLSFGNRILTNGQILHP